jgi:MoxR-like ATPase
MLPFSIWGVAGIGKSDLIKLVAEKATLAFVIFALRCTTR